MLEGLARFNWENVEHAYGPATDVPDQIRALASNDQETRDEALSDLWANIIHQGTVYSATSYAVPFLVELLESPDVIIKPQILVLLYALASGNSFHLVHEPLFEKAGIFQEEMKDPEWHDRIQEELGWVKTAHLAVVAATPVFLNLLNDPDPVIRSCIAYTLSTGHSRAAAIIPHLIERLAIEVDDRVKANLLLTISFVGVSENNILLEKYLDPSNTPVVRAAAAIALAQAARERTSPAAIQILCEAMVNPGPVDAVYCEIPWSDGESIISGATYALSLLGPTAAESTVPRMLDGLDNLSKNDGASILTVGTILALSFDARKEPRTSAELSTFQRSVLERLARCDRTWDWGNVCWAYQHFGLPDNQKKLMEFITDSSAPDTSGHLAGPSS